MIQSGRVWSSPFFHLGFHVGRPFKGVVKAGLYGFVQVGRVVLDREQEVAVGVAGLQRPRFGRFAVGQGNWARLRPH